MKIKAIANGNIVDLPEGEALPLIRAGLFVAVDDEPEAAPVHKTRSYKRRDMQAEPAAEPVDPNEPVWPTES